MKRFSGPCSIICRDGVVSVSEGKLKEVSSFFANECGRKGKAGVILEDLEVETEVVTLALWFLFDIHSKKPREIFALPRLEEMFDFLEKYQFYYEKVGNAFSSRCRETKDYEDTLEFSDSTKRPFAHQIARSCAEKMLQTFRDRDAERKERDDWNPMFDR